MEEKKYNEEAVFMLLKKQGVLDEHAFTFVAGFSEFLRQYFMLEMAEYIQEEEFENINKLEPEDSWQEIVRIVRERSDDSVDMQEIRNEFWSTVFNAFIKSSEAIVKVMDKLKFLPAEEVEVEIDEVTKEVIEEMGFEYLTNKRIPDID